MVDTYSLLQKHEDVIVYRIPDPTNRTVAYLEVGLFPWRLEGASLDEIYDAAAEGRQPVEDTFEGVGLRIEFQPPTRFHPIPEAPIERIKEHFQIKSHGYGSEGRTFRIQEATPAELREAARLASHYTFCYWWALDQHEDFTPGVSRNEDSHERRERLSILQDVHEDGTLVSRDGDTIRAPYTLDSYTLHLAEDWDTPEERCEAAFNDLISDLLNSYPEYAVMQGYRDADTDQIYSDTTKTKSLKQAETFEKAIRETVRDADGIGTAMKRFILREFKSIPDLCEDIRTGGKRLQSHSHIGETVEDSLIDTLIENGYWIPNDSDSDVDNDGDSYRTT